MGAFKFIKAAEFLLPCRLANVLNSLGVGPEDVFPVEDSDDFVGVIFTYNRNLPVVGVYEFEQGGV